MKKFTRGMVRVQTALANKQGAAYVDTTVKILIAVVIGAILLTALVILIKKTAIPQVETRVSNMFTVTGA